MTDRGSSFRTERAVSAGGVVHRRGEDGIEVVICGRDYDGVWGLPKGTPNPGESLEQAATREVSEETGLQVEIERKITTIEYWFAVPKNSVRYHKHVHYYMMSPIGGKVEDHDSEYDRVAWLPVEEACRRLTHQNDIDVVRKAEAFLTRGDGA